MTAIAVSERESDNAFLAAVLTKKCTDEEKKCFASDNNDKEHPAILYMPSTSPFTIQLSYDLETFHKSVVNDL